MIINKISVLDNFKILFGFLRIPNDSSYENRGDELVILQQPQMFFLEWILFRSKYIQIPHQIALSNFDIHIGPNILLIDIENEGRNSFSIKNSNIISLMDVHHTGDFFVHYFNDFISFNYYFEIYDKNIRGGSHQFMASIIYKNLDNSRVAKLFLNMNEFKRWAKGIELSIRNPRIAEELIELTISCELNDINHKISEMN